MYRRNYTFLFNHKALLRSKNKNMTPTKAKRDLHTSLLKFLNHRLLMAISCANLKQTFNFEMYILCWIISYCKTNLLALIENYSKINFQENLESSQSISLKI